MTIRTARLRAAADFGLAIQQARLARGMSQAELAREIDSSQAMISAIESGQSTILLRRLLELADATGITFSATWEDDHDATRG